MSSRQLFGATTFVFGTHKSSQKIPRLEAWTFHFPFLESSVCQGVVVTAFAIGSETQLTSRVAGESDAAGPSGSLALAAPPWRRRIDGGAGKVQRQLYLCFVKICAILEQNVTKYVENLELFV